MVAAGVSTAAETNKMGIGIFWTRSSGGRTPPSKCPADAIRACLGDVLFIHLKEKLQAAEHGVEFQTFVLIVKAVSHVTRDA